MGFTVQYLAACCILHLSECACRNMSKIMHSSIQLLHYNQEWQVVIRKRNMMEPLQHLGKISVTLILKWFIVSAMISQFVLLTSKRRIVCEICIPVFFCNPCLHCDAQKSCDADLINGALWRNPKQILIIGKSGFLGGACFSEDKGVTCNFTLPCGLHVQSNFSYPLSQ